MRICLYARVSTKDKRQDCENQLRELRAYVERKQADGWTLAQEFVDKASGSGKVRPAFGRMMEAASGGEGPQGPRKTSTVSSDPLEPNPSGCKRVACVGPPNPDMNGRTPHFGPLQPR